MVLTENDSDDSTVQKKKGKSALSFMKKKDTVNSQKSLGYDGNDDVTAIDNDLRNSELVFDQHSKDPFEVMRILTYDDAPRAEAKDEIVIRVEASTVSSIDCSIRGGTYPWSFGQKPSFPIIPGSDCVGTITSCGPNAEKHGIEVGDRVAALVLHGGNAKYKTLNYKDCVKVPEDVDGGDAVATIRTYTSAFQALMQGVKGQGRYSRKPLNGKKILIVGACGTFERACVELSLLLGARKVFFSAVSSGGQSHNNYIRLLGAKPLGDDPEEWADVIQGTIDVAIDSICQDRYEHSYAALNDDGILVGTGMSEITKDGNDIFATVEKNWTQMTVALDNSCTYYNGIVDSWKHEKEKCMKDLVYLFNLLEKGKFKPKIATRIPMLKVASAQERLGENLESMERRGIIVVEPWKLAQEQL